VWPKAKNEVLVLAAKDAKRDAELKAAQSLCVPPFAIALAARRLWGRSLTEERDAQLSGHGADEPSRTLQALRGHITRKLLAEIEPLVAGLRKPQPSAG